MSEFIDNAHSYLYFIGICRNTEKNKILNLNLDINRTRHVDLILELNITQEKRMIIYTPKLYFAVTLKPVAELSGINLRFHKT